MHISLTPQLEAFVKSRVASGMYNNASEVVREALRDMCDHEQRQALELEQLRRDVAAGVADIDHGDTVDASEAFAAIRERHGL